MHVFLLTDRHPFSWSMLQRKASFIRIEYEVGPGEKVVSSEDFL